MKDLPPEMRCVAWTSVAAALDALAEFIRRLSNCSGRLLKYI